MQRLTGRWQGAVALFLVAVGFVFAAQMRSRQPIRQATALPTWRLQELAVLVRQQEEARKALEAEVDQLRQKAREYQAAMVEDRGLSQAMAEELARYRLILGLVPVEGPGVSVAVAEGTPGQAGVLPPTLEAQDLSGLANELWSAGAEAMAINGLRVLASTGLRQTPSGIWLGTTRLAPPYRIDAIGDPDALQAALAIRGGFVEGLRAVGLRVTVQRHAVLRLPARPAAEDFRFARPPAEKQP
ncbi:MAG: DUF881 domain-containing protein [Armatimonadetes bacterium]|nr:DUF881 domain-containing protein [Armatimonadota bacterium]